ncbi:MAG: TonB-dependent receptor, partial [Schleiferiaceae bacterium]|nr:TonB-dependent receptor [Schleiferiaceae bacterium]
MNFRKFYIFIFIALSQMAFAQNKGVLKGVVVEKATGETLPNASVTIVGTYYQTLTDFSGEFEIKDIKPGTYTIKVQFIGFSPTQINGVKIKKGQNKPLRVALVEQNEMLNTVTVVGRKNQVDLEQASSAITFSSEEISSLVAKGVEDIVAQQAGVQKTTDGIQIRGARVYETEYLVDGISAQDPLA